MKPPPSRSGFLNAEFSAAASESVKKEERALQQLIRRQIELGHVVLPPPPAPPAQEAEAETAAVQPGEGSGQDLLAETGSNLWRSINPGYLPRPGAYVTTASAAYARNRPREEGGKEEWGEEEAGDTRHHRRRDEHTAFADACLRSATLRRSSAAAAAAAAHPSA